MAENVTKRIETDSETYIQRTVVSTRIRLARNLESYPFPSKLDVQQAQEIIHIVGTELRRTGNFEGYLMRDVSKVEATRLKELRLISPALCEKKSTGAVFVSEDEEVSVMVNEEDHLREQYICEGFSPMVAYERLAAIDENLSRRINFAYDNKLGYLTACPSNVGTGMRASVMMFLPGMTINKTYKEIFRAMKGRRLTVRGAFGEGSIFKDYLFQISNQQTLGKSDAEILEELQRETVNLSDFETRERQRLLEDEKVAVKYKDHCFRAYGELMNCLLLSEEDFDSLILKIRFGAMLGFFKNTKIEDLNDFIMRMGPASFRLENDLDGADTYDCDAVRADIVKRVLPEMIEKD